MQEYADQCEVKVSTLNVGQLTSGTIDYYYFTSETVSDDLFSSADINGDQQKLREKDDAESISLKQRDKGEAMSTQYGISVKGTKENIWKYMDAIKGIDDSVIINSVAIKDYTFGEGLSDEEKI